MSRRAHHPHTPRRQRPLRQMVQRLPTAHPVHHLGAGTDHHSRPIPRPTRQEQGPVGQRRNAEHLPDLPAARRTGNRLAHPPPSPTRTLPRASPQPAMAHHPNSSHQPTNASSTSDSTTDPPAGHTTPPKPPNPNQKPGHRTRQPAPPPPTGNLPQTHTSQRHTSGNNQHPLKLIAQHPPRRWWPPRPVPHSAIHALRCGHPRRDGGRRCRANRRASR